MPSGGELWTTNCRARADMAAQWEQILSAAYVPWTVSIPELPIAIRSRLGSAAGRLMTSH